MQTVLYCLSGACATALLLFVLAWRAAGEPSVPMPAVATPRLAPPQQEAVPVPAPLALSPRTLAALGGVGGSWQFLAPDFETRLLTLFAIMKRDHGIEMVLLEGYRGPARQDRLASGGAILTRAVAFQSYHQYGLAADCAFVRDGKVFISEKDAWTMQAYRHYGAVAESLGLAWGGRWTLADFGHVELQMPGALQR